jgi:hypothetical protein
MGKKPMKRMLLFAGLFLLSVIVTSSARGQETTEEAGVSDERAALPADVGYLGIHIGMSRMQVLEAAESNDMITVPKNRDVDFFPIEEREILTLSVKPEIPFIYLQFFDDVLYAITVIFDEKYMDYYTLCNSLGERYGAYTSLTPQWRQWRLDRVTVKAEKPAVVKYIALHDFLEAASFEGKAPEFDMERRAALLDGL